MDSDFAISEEQFLRLITAAKEGGESAENELLNLFLGKLTVHINRIVRRIAATLVEPEDILQDTLLAAHLALPGYVPFSSRAFLAWLKTIAKNRLTDAIRHQKTLSRGGAFQQVSNHPLGDAHSHYLALYQEITSHLPTPSKIMSNAECVAAIHLVLDDMQSRHRQVLLLKYFQQLTVSQIADRLQVTVGTVKRRLEDARIDLHRRLQEKH